jgi:hypothetical protein
VVTLTGNPNFEGQSSYDFEVIASDGINADDVQTVSLAINNLNELSFTGAGFGRTFTEDGVASGTLFNIITLDTVDASDDITAVAINLTNTEAGDTLMINGQAVNVGVDGTIGPVGGYTYTVSGSTSLLTITHAGQTAGNIETLLEGITFTATGENPNGALIRSFTIDTITDDGGLVDVPNAAATVTITPVNDAPVVTADASTNYAQSASAVVIDSSVPVSDVDSANITSATVTLSNIDRATDVLTLNAAATSAASSASITVTAYNSTTGEMVLTGSATKAEYQAVLEGIQFSSSSANTTNRTVDYLVSDDGPQDSLVTTATIVYSTQSAPTLSSVNDTSWSEGDGDKVLDSAVVVTDIDDTDLEGATITIGTGYVNGEDELLFTNQNGITGSFNSGTGILTLTGTATKAFYQTALESIQYRNIAGDDPTGGARTIDWVLDDGTDTSNIVNSTLTVTGVNDVSFTGTGNAVLFTEDGVASGSLFDVTVLDTVEVGDDITAVVINMANTETGDTLTINGQVIDVGSNGVLAAGGYTYTVIGGGATLTINHAGQSEANIEALLEGITFTATGEDPNAALVRSFTIDTITDDSGLVDVTDASATVTVMAVNDLSFTGTGNAVAFTEDGVASGALFDVTVLDTVEVGDDITAVVINLSNTEAGDIVLIDGTSVGVGVNGVTGPNGNGYTFTVTSGNLLTVTHAGQTAANIETLLEGITFTATSEDPNAALVRGFTLDTITDDGGLVDVADASATVTVTAVNDAPALDLDGDDSTTGGNGYAAIFVEGGAPEKIVDTDTLIIDAEGDDVIIKIVAANILDGANELLNFGTSQITMNANTTLDNVLVGGVVVDVNYVAGTQIFTITDNDGVSPISLADGVSVLEAITYQNNSATPNTATPRVFTITVDDGDVSNTAVSSITVDAVTPIPTVITPIEVDDIANAVEDDDVVVSGTAEANSTVTVTFTDSSFNTVIAVVTTDGAGNWTLAGGNEADISSLDQGTITVNVSSTDTGGNTASAGTANIKHDSTIASPRLVSIGTDSDIPGDFITNDKTLSFTGRSESNAVVEVFINGVSVGTTTANGAGNWTFNHSGTTLANGSYAIATQATDAAGNISPVSAITNVIVASVVDPEEIINEDFDIPGTDVPIVNEQVQNQDPSALGSFTAEGALVSAVTDANTLGSVGSITSDGAVLNVVEEASRSSNYSGRNILNNIDSNSGSFDASGVKGFSMSISLPEISGNSTEIQDLSLFPLRINTDATENQDHLSIRTLLRGRTIFIEIDYVIYSQRDLNAKKYSVTQLDGSALPEWLRIDDAGGLVSGDPPIGTDSFQLRIEITLSDDTVILRYIDVDLTSGEISSLQDFDADSMVEKPLFSNQINEIANKDQLEIDEILSNLSN